MLNFYEFTPWSETETLRTNDELVSDKYTLDL